MYNAVWRADHDLMVVRELRKMANESKAAGKIAPRSADEKLKWLEWPEFVTVRSRLLSLAVLLRPWWFIDLPWIWRIRQGVQFVRASFLQTHPASWQKQRLIATMMMVYLSSTNGLV